MLFAITFWESSAGEMVKAILAALGVLVAIGGVLKAVGKLSGQKSSEAFKILGSTLLLCVFLFRPETLTDIINLIADVVESLIGGSSEIVNNSGGNAPAPEQGG